MHNIVIFPSENSGKLNPAALRAGSTYEIQGSNKSSIQSDPAYPTSSSPFGAYKAVPPVFSSKSCSQCANVHVY